MFKFIFDENHFFIEEETPQSKKVGINIDGIGKIMDLPGLMFIDEECGNLKEVVDCGELTRINDRTRKSEVL